MCPGQFYFEKKRVATLPLNSFKNTKMQKVLSDAFATAAVKDVWSGDVIMLCDRAS